MEGPSEQEVVELRARAASVVLSITGSLLVVIGFAFVGRSAFV